MQKPQQLTYEFRQNNQCRKHNDINISFWVFDIGV